MDLHKIHRFRVPSALQVSLASVLITLCAASQDRALQAVKEVLEVEDSHAGALMQLALIQKDRGELREATRLFVRLLIRDQDNSCLK